MPPVTSRPIGVERNGGPDARMAPPFTSRDVPEEAQADFAQPPAEMPTASYAEPEDIEWQDVADEGVVEPAFAADVHETEAAFAALAQAHTKPDEEFPLDAFIIPEHTRSLPTGMDADSMPADRVHTPVTELADKLEKLSHRLRVEDAQAVINRLAAGDNIDMMLAGLLAGFVAARK